MSASKVNELDGTWAMIRAEYNGEAVPELVAQHTLLEFFSGQYRVRFQGEETDGGTFVLERQFGERSITLHSTAGFNTGRRISGTFQRKGNLLRICVTIPGDDPSSWEVRDENQRFSAIYRLVIRQPAHPIPSTTKLQQEL